MLGHFPAAVRQRDERQGNAVRVGISAECAGAGGDGGVAGEVMGAVVPRIDAGARGDEAAALPAPGHRHASNDQSARRGVSPRAARWQPEFSPPGARGG
jgi:hypothetical protein